jgi:ribosomal protein S18 acetylase RimI-like enzyme
MNYEIMPITEQYIESFRQAVGSVAREKKFLAFLDTPSEQMSEEFVLTNIKDSWPHIIAVKDNTVIGWCDITSLNRPVFSHAGSLGIGILKEFRGHGIGKALMKQALELAHKKGLTRIELTVREDNQRAIGLYKTFNFKIEGIHQKSILIDGDHHNQVFMALLFE